MISHNLSSASHRSGFDTGFFLLGEERGDLVMCVEEVVVWGGCAPLPCKERKSKYSQSLENEAFRPTKISQYEKAYTKRLATWGGGGGVKETHYETNDVLGA